MSKKRVSNGGDDSVSKLIYAVGVVLAGVSSWLVNHSIGWAIVHGIFSWAYLIYLCAGCGGGLPRQLF